MSEIAFVLAAELAGGFVADLIGSIGYGEVFLGNQAFGFHQT